MPAPLPKELRDRFARLLREGLSGREASRRLQVSAATGGRWARQIRSIGVATVAPMGRPAGSGKLAAHVGLPASVRLARYAAQRGAAKAVKVSMSYPMDMPQIGVADALPFPWVQASQQADIDISGPEFNFVRSIKVWDIQFYSHRRVGSDENGGCQEQAGIRLGSYNTQGAYSWTTVRMDNLPSWLSTTIPRSCTPPSQYRGIGIEWQDFEGNHDFEIVRY